MIKPRFWICACAIAFASNLYADRQSCGTHWTGWVKADQKDKNPCPNQCERGEKLNEKTWGKAPDLQFDIQYQCYFPAPVQSAYGETRSISAPSTANGSNTDRFPFIRGSVDDPKGKNGAWLNWQTRKNAIAQQMQRKHMAWFPYLDAMAQIVKDSPAMSTMREYYPWISFGVDDTISPLPRGSISIIFWDGSWVIPAPEAPDGIKLKERAWGYAPGGIDVYYNWWPDRANGASDELTPREQYKDAQGFFFQLNKPDQLIDGFPVHGGWLLVTGKNKPELFIPVSQERVLKAFMARATSLMADIKVANSGANEGLDYFTSPETKKMRQQMIEQAGAGESDPKKAAAARAKAAKDDAEQERQLRELSRAANADNPIYMAAKTAFDDWQQKLNSMSTAQKNAPAYGKALPETFLQEDIVPVGTEGAYAYMQYNPAYINKSLSKEVPQIMVIGIGTSTDASRSPDALARMTVKERVRIAVVERTKWSKVQALLK